MSTLELAALVLFGMLILVVGGLLYLQNWVQTKHTEAKARFEERQRPHRLANEAWLAEEKKTARYILTHNPTKGQIREILQNPASPHDKDLAIETALSSGNIWTIGLIHDFAPEASPRARMATLDIFFLSMTGEEALATLKKWEDLHSLDTPYREWWRAWKPKLEAKAQRVIDRQQAEAEAERRAASQASSDEEDDDKAEPSVWDDDDSDYWEPEPTDWSSG
ncbi:MAG: hypothetical protein WCT33_01515 [Patescibacteria group bacterium]|jgi:hypothetical protein